MAPRRIAAQVAAVAVNIMCPRARAPPVETACREATATSSRPAHKYDDVPGNIIVRQSLGGQRDGPRAFRPEPVHRDSAVALQPRRDPARAGHRALHQRSADLHLRAEEQPHETDRGRRCPPIPQGSQSPREAVRVRAVRGPLRGRRERGAFLHAPGRRRLVVPPVQPRLERRRRESPEPERHQDRLPVARCAVPGKRGGHS